MSVLSDAPRDRHPSRRRGGDTHDVPDRFSERLRKARLALPAVALIWAMVIPLTFDVASLRLTPNRLVLVVMVLPCLAMLLSGRAGRIRFPDIGLILLWAWSVVAVAANNGFASQFQSIGIYFVETVGAYLIGRVFVRDADGFAAMARAYFATILLLLPIVVVETLTGHSPLLDFMGAIGNSYPESTMGPRLGYYRAQGAFQHPILLGVYGGGAIAIAYFVLGYQRRGIAKLWRMLVTLFTALTCLSSGPIAAMVAQIGMIFWDSVLHAYRRRWWLLAGLAVFSWVFVDVFSNRTPPEVFISHFALNGGTAYNRILIWQFGSASVLNHPWLGIGHNDWARPSWMTGSMDMYWLVVPVAYGLPAGLLNLFAFLWIFLRVALRRGLDDRQNAYRLGFLGCMLGFFMVGWTVHFWKETYVMFMFLMGSGVWFLDARSGSDQGSGHPGGEPPDRGPAPDQQSRRVVL